MAAPKKTQAPQATSEADLNDLLSLTADDEKALTDKAPVVVEDSSEPVATDLPEDPAPSFDSIQAEPEVDEEDEELARLQAELSKPAPVYTEVELTPKQRQIQELRDKLAQRQAEEIAAAAPSYEDELDPNADKILIHIVEDGITIQGEVWYRGQEIEFTVGSKAHQQTLNKYGKSWLDMADDEEAQYNRWGKLYFKAGPWRGRRLSQIKMSDLPPDATEADLERIRRAENKRIDAPVMK